MDVFDIVMENLLKSVEERVCLIYTISSTPIASTDFSRFFHHYIKHTHRFDGFQQVFP
jgi:hypothetical protein